MQEYERVGFPQQCLNVAASLGSGSAAIQFPSYSPIVNVNGYYNGDFAFLFGNFLGNIVLQDPEVCAKIKASALANKREAEYYSDRLYVRKYVFGADAWGVNEDLVTPIYLYSTASMLPLDNAPGGYFPVSTFFEANDIVKDLPTGSSLDVLPSFCFVPTVSALALDDWQDKIMSNLGNVSELAGQSTRFSDCYAAADANGSHVDVSAAGEFVFHHLTADEPFPKNYDAALENLYCVGARQTFSSSGKCGSNPVFDYAELTFSGTQRSENGFINSLDEWYYNTFVGKPTRVRVHTHTNDIINDKDLDYNFNEYALAAGRYKKSEGGSDPCYNNWNDFHGGHREEYKQTTEIIVDEPVYLSLTPFRSTLKTEGDTLILQVSNAFNNGSKMALAVAPVDGSSDWRTIQYVNSGDTLRISYEDIIVGRLWGSVSSSWLTPIKPIFLYEGTLSLPYGDWLGKDLKFRVLKTLVDGSQTYGNRISGIKFIPEPISYYITYSKRKYCEAGVTLSVKLSDSRQARYMTLDTSRFSWVLSNAAKRISGDCYMESTSDNRLFNIKLKSGQPLSTLVTDEVDKEWTLQLKTVDGEVLSDVKRFMLPGKPRGISAVQLPPQYVVGATSDTFHLPNRSSIYAMISITDSAYIYRRLPYQLLENGQAIATISNILSSNYDSLSLAEKISWRAEFEEHYRQHYNDVGLSIARKAFVANLWLLLNRIEHRVASGFEEEYYFVLGEPYSRYLTASPLEYTYRDEDGNFYLCVIGSGSNQYEYYSYFFEDREWLSPYQLAEEFRDRFKEFYRLQWLAKRLGTRVSTGIKLNTLQILQLRDADSCVYGPFSVLVTAPPDPNMQIT
jgi:hypothetical protein